MKSTSRNFVLHHSLLFSVNQTVDIKVPIDATITGVLLSIAAHSNTTSNSIAAYLTTGSLFQSPAIQVDDFTLATVAAGIDGAAFAEANIFIPMRHFVSTQKTLKLQGYTEGDAALTVECIIYCEPA